MDRETVAIARSTAAMREATRRLEALQAENEELQRLLAQAECRIEEIEAELDSAREQMVER